MIVISIRAETLRTPGASGPRRRPQLAEEGFHFGSLTFTVQVRVPCPPGKVAGFLFNSYQVFRTMSAGSVSERP